MKALVFDQIESVADDIAHILRTQLGAEVDVVRGWDEATQKLEGTQYDLGVIGVQFPGSLDKDSLASLAAGWMGWTSPVSKSPPAQEEIGLSLVRAIRHGRDHTGQNLGIHNANMRLLVHSPSADPILESNSAFLGAEMCCPTHELTRGNGEELIARVRQVGEMESYMGMVKRFLGEYGPWLKMYEEAQMKMRGSDPTGRVNDPYARGTRIKREGLEGDSL